MRNAGRVEVCKKERWTYICDNNWGFKDAQIVCRELGYSPYGRKNWRVCSKIKLLCCVGAVPTNNCSSENQLSFSITDINCTGSEEHLINCSHSNAILDNCNSHDGAGVVCQGMY